MKDKKKCLFCGYLWISIVENPKECPKCKNRKWDETNIRGRDNKRRAETDENTKSVKAFNKQGEKEK